MGEFVRLSDELYHYGVKGMKWGVRRYVNYDGTLTPKGQAKLNRFKNKERAKAFDKRAKDLSYILPKYQRAYAKKKKSEITTSNKAKQDKLDKKMRKIAANANKVASRWEAIINEIEKADFNKMLSIKKERLGMNLVSSALGLAGEVAYAAISKKRNARRPGEWLDDNTINKINADSENADYDYQPDVPYRRKKS